MHAMVTSQAHHSTEEYGIIHLWRHSKGGGGRPKWTGVDGGRGVMSTVDVHTVHTKIRHLQTLKLYNKLEYIKLQYFNHFLKRIFEKNASNLVFIKQNYSPFFSEMWTSHSGGGGSRPNWIHVDKGREGGQKASFCVDVINGWSLLHSNSACSMLMSDDLRLPRRGIEPRPPRSTLPLGHCPSPHMYTSTGAFWKSCAFTFLNLLPVSIFNLNINQARKHCLHSIPANLGWSVSLCMDYRTCK